MNSQRTGPEKHFGIQTLKRVASELEKRADLIGAASLRYSIANSLKTMARHREAVREYRSVAKLNPSYFQRNYFWQELAGVLFDNGRYKLSAKLYGISLSLGEKKRTRLLYGDALLFSGEYLEAIQAFGEGLNSNENYCAPEWHLKLLAISWLRETLKLDRQNRKTPQLVDSMQHQNMDDLFVEKKYREFLVVDALYQTAWFNIGIVRHRQGDIENAAMCFLLSSLIVPSDVESWTNAFGLASEMPNSSLAGWILMAAYEKHDEAIIREIAQRFPDNREEIYRLFSQMLEKLPNPNSNILRIHQEEGKWHEIYFDEFGSPRSTIE